MPYPNDIGQTAEVADGVALSTIPNNRASAIPAGTHVVLEDVTNAITEVELRKSAKQLGFNVTDAEVAQSVIRQHAVVSHHASLEGGALTNAELLDALTSQINTRFNEVNTRFNEVNTRFNEVNTRLNEVNTRLNDVNTRFNEVNTRFDALDAAAFNLRAQRANKHIPNDGQLTILKKEVPGLLDLAHAMFETKRPDYTGQPAAINTPLPLPPGVTTVNDLNSLTLLQISNLARESGTNFGIVATDDCASRRMKIVDYFLGRTN